MGCGVVWKFRWAAVLSLLLVPAMSAAQISDFCPLLNGRIVAEDGQFLGRITANEVAADSLVNRFGAYGSKLSSTSIFNTSTYGSDFSPVGPFNPDTIQPPRVLINGQTLARLTVNTAFPVRVDPNGLVAWLRSSGPGMCGGPPPVSTPTPTAEDTATATEPPAATATAVDTATSTRTRTRTNTGTPTETATITRTPTETGTPTQTRTRTPSPTQGPCYGDCNLDGQIRINELITGVNIALGTRDLADCRSFDITLDGRVNVGELIRAVRNVIHGCIPLEIPTATVPPTATMPTATVTETRTPTVLDTPSPTATATVVGECPGVTPVSVSFRALGELTESEQEFSELAATLEVQDVRQKHRVSVALSSCADDPPGVADYRIAIEGLGDTTFSAPILSACGDIADASGGATFDLPVGSYPLSLFVAGRGTYTGGALSIGPAPVELVSTRAILSTISLIAGEFEIPDLRTTIEIDEPCSLVQVVASLVVGGLAPDVGYEVRIVIDNAREKLSPLFTAGTANDPTTNTLTATYQDLPVGEHTFAVFVNQIDRGPALYERESTLEVSLR